VSWQGLNFDFTGILFDGGDFSEAQFSGGTVLFTSAEFSGGMVYFGNVEFSGGNVRFSGARFSGSEVYFSLGQFSGSQIDFGAEETGHSHRIFHGRVCHLQACDSQLRKLHDPNLPKGALFTSHRVRPAMTDPRFVELVRRYSNRPDLQEQLEQARLKIAYSADQASEVWGGSVRGCASRI